ncbi:MAG: ABC transporter permease, partial [Desulfobacterales bacterium]
MKIFRNIAHRWHRFIDGDIFYSFRRSPVTVAAAGVTAAFMLAAAFAPIVAPHNTYDLSTLSLLDAFTPPAWEEDGTTDYLLGTDDQGRCILSTIIYGARLSLGVGLAAVVFSGVIGVLLGLISGIIGGVVDAVIMRVAEIQLTFP